METVVSRDGTPIAFERTGAGPPLVLVHGSTADHRRWAVLLPRLTERFTVLAMDRRGRGASGDAPDYALEREYEDVAAVLRAAGPGASLLGHSFGALCAMEAALRVPGLRRLVLYEPGFPVDGAALYPPGLLDRLRALLDAGDRDGFLAAFFRDGAGLSDAQIDTLRADPSWPARLAGAHTALREAADGDYVFAPDRFAALAVPTLLVVGGASPPELTAPSRALAAALPDSRIAMLPGQGHAAITTAPEMFLGAVLPFLAAGA